VAVDSAVVFSSVLLLPLHADPQFSLAVGRFAIVDEGTEIPDYSCRVVEEDLPAYELMLVLLVVVLETFCFCFEVVGLGLSMVLLEGLCLGLRCGRCHRWVLSLVGLHL
jgi:hypothetical protein